MVDNKECNLIEKWYETKYNKEKFTFSLNDIKNYKCNHKLDYPPKNLFIPNNFDILPIMNENMTWDLEIMYKGHNDPKYKADFKALKTPRPLKTLKSSWQYSVKK